MAISTYPGGVSVEPIFTLTIDQWPKSQTVLPAPLPPGNYQLNTEYATDTIYLYFLEATNTETINATVTLAAASNRAIFFTLTNTCDRVFLINSETAAANGAILSVNLLKRGLPTEGATAEPWEAYEVPDRTTVGWSGAAMEVVGDKLYLIGGNTSRTTSWNQESGTNGQIRSLDLTDLDNPTWTTHLSASGGVLDGNALSSVVIGTDIWFQVPQGSGENCNLFKYDTVGASLADLGAMPLYIDTSIAPLVKNNAETALYKYGNWNVSQTVGRYTIATNTWTQLNNLPWNGRYAGQHNAHPTDSDKIILRNINSQASFYYHNLGADTYTAGAALTASDPPSPHQTIGTVTPNASYYILPDTGTTTSAALYVFDVLKIYPSDSITTNASAVLSTATLFSEFGWVGTISPTIGSNRIAFHSSGDMWMYCTSVANNDLAARVYRLPAAKVPAAWTT